VVLSGPLPGHSGATVPDSHRLPSSGSNGIRPPSRPAAESGRSGAWTYVRQSLATDADVRPAVVPLARDRAQRAV